MSESTSPIDWVRAERVALAISARHRSASSGWSAAELAPTPAIEDAIELVTGLRPAHGSAQVRFVDRGDWIRANLASFRTMLAPLLGWMSTRVLGQYDTLLGRPPDDDAVYLLAPNLADIERRYGFDPGEFRTWVLLHELTHRAQFTGVPWMRDHFAGLVTRSLSFADPDPGALIESMRVALRNRRDAAAQVRDGGVLGLLASPEQREVMAQIGGLMSLLEGHGDVTMTRAAGPMVPNAPRFERILRERRRNANPLSRAVMRLTGVEAKLNQYAAGARFIDAVEQVGGPRVVDRCWESADALPTLDEVRAPQHWLSRMGLAGG